MTVEVIVVGIAPEWGPVVAEFFETIVWGELADGAVVVTDTAVDWKRYYWWIRGIKKRGWRKASRAGRGGI